MTVSTVAVPASLAPPTVRHPGHFSGRRQRSRRPLWSLPGRLRSAGAGRALYLPPEAGGL